ncbi:DUF3313 domain-containing protein [bacterium]|nr:DUF3313 domain-containing protein [bacterium]
MISRNARSISIVCALVCAALMAGCGTYRMSRYEPSGYLGDYSMLKPGDSDQAQLLYVNDAIDFSRYDNIYIRPIDLYDPKGTDLSKLKPEDRARLREMLDAALRKELGADYELVDAPGPGTMTLKVAVTEARPSKPIRNIISSVLPIGLAISAVKRVLFGTHVAVGHAAIEAELDDANGRRLAAAVARRAGRKWGAGNFSSWGDVDSAFNYWARQLRSRLDQLRERNTKQG